MNLKFSSPSPNQNIVKLSHLESNLEYSQITSEPEFKIRLADVVSVVLAQQLTCHMDNYLHLHLQRGLPAFLLFFSFLAHSHTSF